MIPSLFLIMGFGKLSALEASVLTQWQTPVSVIKLLVGSVRSAVSLQVIHTVEWDKKKNSPCNLKKERKKKNTILQIYNDNYN